MLNLYSVYSNVRRMCALLCPAISFLHFHVLHFDVRHLHVLHFQCPQLVSVKAEALPLIDTAAV